MIEDEVSDSIVNCPQVNNPAGNIPDFLLKMVEAAGVEPVDLFYFCLLFQSVKLTTFPLGRVRGGSALGCCLTLCSGLPLAGDIGLIVSHRC